MKRVRPDRGARRRNLLGKLEVRDANGVGKNAASLLLLTIKASEANALERLIAQQLHLWSQVIGPD